MALFHSQTRRHMIKGISGTRQKFSNPPTPPPPKKKSHSVYLPLTKHPKMTPKIVPVSDDPRPPPPPPPPPRKYLHGSYANIIFLNPPKI